MNHWFVIHSEVDMAVAAAQILSHLPTKGLVALYGELGAGKTTLMRGLLRAAGYHGPVTSPTYTFYEVYDFEDREIVHGDWYRCEEGENLFTTGIDQYLEDALCCFEWPDRVQGQWPAFVATIHINRMKDHPEGRFVWVQTA